MADAYGLRVISLGMLALSCLRCGGRATVDIPTIAGQVGGATTTIASANGTGGLVGSGGQSAMITSSGGTAVSLEGPVPVFHCGGEKGVFSGVCQLGMEPVYEVECQVTPSLKFYFLLGIGLGTRTPLNQPLDFSQIPSGTGNVRNIHGYITFLEANFADRTFTARLTNVSFDRGLSNGRVQQCTLDDGIIRGIPGDFL